MSGTEVTIDYAALPSGLRAQAALGPQWQRWLEGLPKLLAQGMQQWDLRRDGPELWHGFCSLVVPVRDATGTPAALKVSYDGDDESQHEALALRHWAGNGTVRLLRADPPRRTLLLERARRRDLTKVPALDACEIVARLWDRIHIPAPPQFVRVTTYVERWLAALDEMPRDAPIPRRLVEQALSAGRDLITDPDSCGTLIHGDLHYENVLAADREPWLVIDPNPMSGDPHYEIEPMLINRMNPEDLGTQDRLTAIRARFYRLVEAGGLDIDRARDWVVVRAILNAHWAIEDAERMHRSLTAAERDWISRCIIIAKATHP